MEVIKKIKEFLINRREEKELITRAKAKYEAFIVETAQQIIDKIRNPFLEESRKVRSPTKSEHLTAFNMIAAESYGVNSLKYFKDEVREKFEKKNMLESFIKVERYCFN